MLASGPTVMNRINRYGGMLGRPANLIKMSLGFGGQGTPRARRDARMTASLKYHKNMSSFVQNATMLTETAPVD